MLTAQNYVDGQFVDYQNVMDIVSPVDGTVLGKVPATAADVAVEAAQAAARAADAWASLAPATRGSYLQKAATLLEANAESLAQLATREMGKPIAEMRGEVMRGVNILRYYAAEGWHAVGEVIPSSDSGTLQYTIRVPLGPVVLITPWNFPVAIPLWKIAPALVYGNTVVWKPAEQASLSADALMRILHEAGLPPGVLNCVMGVGSELGPALVEADRVQGVSFTGSTRVGRDVASRASGRGIKYQTEMGGKNAVIVANDADLDVAVDVTLNGAMRSAGQKCTATSRVIVDEAVFEAFRDKLVEKVRGLTVGHPSEPSTYMGPVASHRQRDRILGYIQKGQEEGARIVVGGKAPEDERLSGGAYVLPTVFEEVDARMTIAREEIFGPVVALMKARDFDHAIALLNDSDYGLSASLFTNSLDRAMKFVKRADVGMVRVNSETAGLELHAPFGGMKQSSSHSREQGRAALDFYTHSKTVAITM